MTALIKEKINVVAEQNGWPVARAQGYVDGEIARKRNRVPPQIALIGCDEYCLGFRAGYFAAVRNPLNIRPGDKEILR